MKYCITPSTTNTATRARSMRLSEPGSFCGLRYSVNDSSFPVGSLRAVGAFLYQKIVWLPLWPAARSSLAFSIPYRFAPNRVLILANSSVLLRAARRLNTSPPSFLGRDHSPHARKDCNARSAKAPAPIHKANRVWRLLLQRTPNSWERSGRRPEDKEKWRLYKTEDKMLTGSS
jgi:hypothetical protein